MARIKFLPQGAWDPIRNGVAQSAQLTFFATSDTSNLTPLTSYNEVGQAAPIVTSETGWTGEFDLDGLPAGATEARWVSGEWSGIVVSYPAMQAERLALRQEVEAYREQGVLLVSTAEGAAADAQAARVAAEEAAQNAGGGLPDGGGPGQTVSRTDDGDVVWVPFPTSGIQGAPTVWPQSFNPTAHTQPVSTLRRADDTALAALVVSLLTATGTETEVATRIRGLIGAGTGNGTSNLTLGAGPTQAMAGNRAFSASEISASVTGLTGQTVNEALASLLSRVRVLEQNPGGGPGGGSDDVYDVFWNRTTNTWREDPTTPPTGSKAIRFYGPAPYVGAPLTLPASWQYDPGVTS